MSRHKKFLKFLFVKFPIIIGVFCVLLIITLKLVERYPEPLRQGFEQYISNGYQTNATIGKLEKVTFFPKMDVQMKDITMHNSSNAALVDMEIKSVSLSAPFWSVMTSMGKFYKIEIKNLSATREMISPKPIEISSVYVTDRNGPEQYGSFLVGEGTYDGKNMRFEVELNKNKDLYSFPKQVSFFVEVDQMTFNATLYRKLRSVTLENASFAIHDQKINDQNYELMQSREIQNDNPLMCMINHADAQKCSEYLK